MKRRRQAKDTCPNEQELKITTKKKMQHTDALYTFYFKGTQSENLTPLMVTHAFWRQLTLHVV